MRLHLITLSSLLAAAPPATAQTPAGHAGWHLGGGVEAVRFGHVAVSGGLPGTAAEIRPSPRSAVHLSAGRTLGPWAVGLEAGWAGGHVEAAAGWKRGRCPGSAGLSGHRSVFYRVGLGVSFARVCGARVTATR